MRDTVLCVVVSTGMLAAVACARSMRDATIPEGVKPEDVKQAMAVRERIRASEMPGWRVVEQTKQMTAWTDVEGDAVTLTWVPDAINAMRLPPLSDENAIRRYCRDLAETMKGGLVEAAVVQQVDGPVLKCVYKRLEIPAFKFFGMLVIPASDGTWVWMSIFVERGTTGVREATVTKHLFDQGKLTFDSYQSSWARDPYDPTYGGVDSRTLRYLSDDEIWDQQFPAHPLSKLRRELRRLLSVSLEPTRRQ